MTENSPKPLYCALILDILKKYSNAESPLAQNDIIKKLEDDYELTQAPATIRKTINRNLKKLIATGYPIEKVPKPNAKISEDKELQANQYNWYYQKDKVPDESQFEEPELRFLLDSIASSTQIPTGKMRKDLLRKVALLASESETIENIETIKNHAKILENFHVRHKEGSTKETNQQFF